MVSAMKHPAIVKLLVDHGANLKRRITWLGGSTGVSITGDEVTALHFAVGVGNLESVKVLVIAGLDPNAADDKGQTPLHVALLLERWKHRISSLVDRDKVATITPTFGRIVEYLLINDASLRFKDRKGRTPAQLAEQIGSPKVIRQLLSKAQEERDAKRQKALEF